MNVAQTRSLQDVILRDVQRRGVVFEVLPTSNLRIGVYERYREHHILRWLGFGGGPEIPVCVGSDDPGIFATNLRNEYVHLLRELRHAAAGAGRQPEAELERLVRNGKTYRFS